MYELINKFKYFKSIKLNKILEEKRRKILLEWVDGKPETEIFIKYGDFGKAIIKAEKSRLCFPALDAAYYLK